MKCTPYFFYRSSDSTYNYVDRVRIGKNSIYDRNGPNRGSGWRQKSSSHSDLITSKKTNLNHSNLRASRSLDWNNNNLCINGFQSYLEEPEKDYDDYNSNYANTKQQRADYYNPFEIGQESCSLRRTRSLAVIREETFNDLQISSSGNTRRSQLIPRAKLVNRSFFRKRFYQKQRKEDDSTGSGIETQTSETRESDDYYHNSNNNLNNHRETINNETAVKVPVIWPNDKSDLESLNSEYFKNSSHQQEHELHQHQQHKQQQQQEKKNRRTPTGNHFQLLEIEVHQDNSQSSAFPETTPSDSSEEQSDSSSIQLDEDERILYTLSQPTTIYEDINLKEDEVKEEEDQNKFDIDYNKSIRNSLTFKKITRDNSSSKPFIAYDSVDFSSEDTESSDGGTIIEDNYSEKLNDIIPIEINNDCSSLLQISIEDEFDEQILKDITFEEEHRNREQEVNEIKLSEEEDESEEIYSEITTKSETHSGNTIKKTIHQPPKILSVERKLKTLSDYAKTAKGGGVLEHLTYVSTSQILKANDIAIIDSFHPNLIDKQYCSLPDINIGQSLKVSERIDAKLRSTYNQHSKKYSKNFLPNVDETNSTDSIKKFGRIQKRIRQREYSEVDTLIKANIPPLLLDDNKVEIFEQPREAPTIEVKAVCKEKEVNNSNNSEDLIINESPIKFNNSDQIATIIKSSEVEEYNKVRKEIVHHQEILHNINTVSGDFQLNEKTNNFPGGSQQQFRIIVTDVQNNIIEEDSIESIISTANNSREEEIENENPETKPEHQILSLNKENIDIKKEKIEIIEKPGNENTKNFLIEKIQTNTVNKSCLKIKSQNRSRLLKTTKAAETTTTTTTNIFKAQPVRVYPNDEDVIRINDDINIKMSRPQILHVIDSSTKKCQHQQNSPTNGGGSQQNNDVMEKEFLQKVDSVRTYWSKFIQNEKDTAVAAATSTATATVDDDPLDEKSNPNSYVTSVENESSENGTSNRSNRMILVSRKDTKLLNSSSSSSNDLQSFTPTIEIVELDGEKQATIVNAQNAENSEFDHVRYKIMKPNLFKNNILTRNKKEAQFDGLLQYLQDYSFQELLNNNNVVIIEPIRTKIEKPSTDSDVKPPHTVNCKITGGSGIDSKSSASKRHFFYHPVRVNRELLEDELPTPDTVRNVRKFFEENLDNKKIQTTKSRGGQNSTLSTVAGTTTSTTMTTSSTTSANNKNLGSANINSNKRRSLRYLTIDTTFRGGLRKWDSTSLSSGISSGGLSSPCDCNDIEQNNQEVNMVEHIKNHQENDDDDNANGKDNTTAITTADEQGEIYSSEENLCDDELCESYYVSEDILEKIRECGSTVTYYGGRVVDNKSPEVNPMNKTIVEENKGREWNHNCHHLHDSLNDNKLSKRNSNTGLGVKFKLVKSNSCSSRLELVGTNKNDSNSIDGVDCGEVQRYSTTSPPTEPEETVRELVNRLESGAINKPHVPRIIESQCIEKTFRTGSLDNNTNNNNTNNSSTSSNNNNNLNSYNSVTINNHLTTGGSSTNGLAGDSNGTSNEGDVGLVDIIKQVTVNNHISFCQTTACNMKSSSFQKINSPIITTTTTTPSTLSTTKTTGTENSRNNIVAGSENIKTSDINKIQKQQQQQLGDQQQKQEEQQKNNSKVCRNKNVDLALNMTKSVSMNKIKSENKQKENDINKRTESSNASDVSSSSFFKKQGNSKDSTTIISTTTKSNIKEFLSEEKRKISSVEKCNTSSDERCSIVKNGIHRIISNSNKMENGEKRNQTIKSATFSTATNSDKFEKTNSKTNQMNGNNKDIPLGENLEFVDKKLNDDSNRHSDQQQQQQQRSSKVEVTISSTNKSFVKHYVTNDKKLVEKKSYNDIEFEEFEVYNPVTMASVTSDSGNDLVSGSTGSTGSSERINNGNGTSNGSSNSEDCYDSLDDKV